MQLVQTWPVRGTLYNLHCTLVCPVVRCMVDSSDGVIELTWYLSLSFHLYLYLCIKCVSTHDTAVGGVYEFVFVLYLYLYWEAVALHSGSPEIDRSLGHYRQWGVYLYLCLCLYLYMYFHLYLYHAANIV